MRFFSWLRRLARAGRTASRRSPAAPCRPRLEVLEDRCTPSGFSYLTALGGGNSAVSLLVNVQFPPDPVAPEVVSVSQVLPNGNILQFPPQSIISPTPPVTPTPIHELFAPSPLRGLLQSAQVSSSVFVPPTTTGGIINGT